MAPRRAGSLLRRLEFIRGDNVVPILQQFVTDIMKIEVLKHLELIKIKLERIEPMARHLLKCLTEDVRRWG
jgi:hypothetical protein